MGNPFRLVSQLNPVVISGNVTMSGAPAVSLGGNTAGVLALVSTGTIHLMGGNNVTLSQNGQSVTISAGGGGVGGTVNISAGTTSNNLTNFVLSNSNGLSFGLNGSTITASHNGLTQQSTQPVAISGSNGSFAFSTATFGNLNGLSFYTSNGSVVGSYTVPTQSVQPVAVSGSNGSFTFSTATFGNLNGLSFYTSNGSVVGSYTVPTLTNSSMTMQAGGSTLSSVSRVAFVDSNGVSFGASTSNNGSITITATVKTDYLTSQSNQAFSAAGGSSAFQTLGFSNTNGVSFSNSNGSVVASVATDYAASNHSHGNPTLALTNLSGTTASNSAGLTLSLSAAAPGAGGFQSAGFSTQGNTAGDTGFASQSIQFVGGNNITLSGATGAGGVTMTISGANAGGAQTGISGIGVSDTTYTSGTVIYSAQANVTLGSSVNGASQYVRISANPAQTVQPVAISGSNGSFNFSTATFGNLNGMSFYTSNGSMVGSYTVPTVTNSSFSIQDSATTINPVARIAFSTGNNITLSLSTGASSATVGIAHNLAGTSSGFAGNLISGSITHNSSGLNLSLNHPAWLTTAMQSNAATISNIRVSGGTTSNLLSALTFADSNGISFGLNASTMTVTVRTNYASSDHSHGNPTLNLTNLSGTTASNSAGFTLSLSAAAPGGGADVVASASNGSFSFTTLGFSNANNVTFGTSAGSIITASVAAPGAAAENNWMHALGANTAGNTTASGSTIGLSGINMTISGTNNSVFNLSVPPVSSLVGTGGISLSTNGSTISIGPTMVRSYANFINHVLNSQTQQALASTFVVLPMLIQSNVSFDFIRFAHSVSLASTSFASTANTTFSYNQNVTFRLGLYSRNIDASSMSLALVSTTTAGMTISVNAAYGSASNTQQANTFGITYPNSVNTSSFSSSYSTSNLSTMALSTGNYTRMSGMKFLDMPFAMSLTPGQYWLAVNASTTQTTQGTANLSGMRLLYSTIGLSQPNNTLGNFAEANNASIQWFLGVGSFTTAGGATTNALGFSNVSSSASHVIPFVTLSRTTN